MAAHSIVRWARLRGCATFVTGRKCFINKVMVLIALFAEIVLAAALVVKVELVLVHLGHSLDFLQCYGTLTEWTACIDHEPLLNARSVEIVSYITRQRRHK